MQTDERTQPSAPPASRATPSTPRRIRTRLAVLSVYGLELFMGIVLALGFFFVLLEALHRWFPDSTDLGRFARTPLKDRREIGDRSSTGADAESLAVLSRVHGEVQDKPADSIAWSVSRRGTRLGNGHAVQSYARAEALVSFDDHNSIELAENTVVVLRGPGRASPAQPRRAAVLFMDGFMRARIGRGSAEEKGLEILAAGGSVRLAPRGGGDAEVALNTDRKGGSSLAVLGGTAEIRWQEQATIVQAGHMVTFDAAHAPGAPVPLPAAPVPVAPAAGETFRFRGNPPRILLEWRAADGAEEFRVQLARDPGFGDTVYSGRVREPRLAHGGLDQGRYFWRVTGLRGGIEGPPSAVARFEIVREQTLPRLIVEFPAGVVTEPALVLRGVTDPGCRVFVNAASATTDSAGRFEQTLALRHGYNVFVVQAVDPVGNTTFRNHTVMARLAEAEEQP